MLTSLNWLKEYVDIDLTPEEIDDLLTNSGTKIETIEPLNENVQGVVAGLIKKIEKHPNADKLLLCTVDIGEEEPATIITSAQNVFEGALVPVAVAGSTIADGTKMEKTSFRGIESEGMFCSVEELGMNTDLFQKEITEGIYILPEGFAEPGTDLREPLWIDDQILDIELTANRGDCQSVYGVAREAAAAQGKSVRPIETRVSEGVENIDDYLSVGVESELCPRYTARMFKVNEIKPSPMWMQLRLLNSGVRPINNIVDVTNYVMLEMGQPLHAFDYKSIGSDEIIVRTGNTDKTVTTLDGNERPITPEMLMITNGEYPIAVAGVMGGYNSEIKDDTELVVLESANFDKTSIRLTSRKLGLRTESSSRYEKGIYPELAAEASARAAHLFEAIGAATPIKGFIDIQTQKGSTPDVDIEVDINWLNNFLGTNLSMEQIREYLNRLFLGTAQIGEDTILVRIPQYRQDLRIREDIAEEVARLYGYNNLPSTIMSGETFVGERTGAQKFEAECVKALTGMGLYQTMTTSFTGPSELEALGFNPEADKVLILNPLGEESSFMRPTLLPSQLGIINLNNSRGIPEGGFFEIQKTYHAAEEGNLPEEQRHIVLSEYGPEADFFDLKGKIEELLALSGIDNAVFSAGGSSVWHPGRKAQIYIDDLLIGEMGQIHPGVAKKTGLPDNVFAAELSFDKLYENAGGTASYTELPRFPENTRDLAVVVDKAIPAGDILNTIRQNSGEFLESAEIFDVYTGEQIPEDKKSIAFNLVFRHPEKTLTDEEVNPVMDRILKALQTDYSAVLRA